MSSICRLLSPRLIVYRSGIGGLSAAALLAKAGKKVLVLEQHDQAGGCCHTFIDKGYEFDVGIHYIGEMRNRTAVKYLMDTLTDGQLVWDPLPDVYEQCVLGNKEDGTERRFPICTGSRDKFVSCLKEKFPSEHAAIDRFMDLLDEVRRELKGYVSLKFMPVWMSNLLIWTGLVHKTTKYFKLSQRTLTDVLNELTSNEDLRAVL